MPHALFGPGAEVFDVTLPLSPGMAVWPGDAATELTSSSRIASGAPCNVSRLACSTHAGTHVDAPWHFVETGKRLDEVPPERWIGPCLVVNICPETAWITAEDLERAGIDQGVDRVILRTKQDAAPDPSRFNPAYTALTVDAARWLLHRRIMLVGIDTPSIEPFDDIDHGVHHTLLGAGMLIIENLALAAVEPGPYLLICLPLRLIDADGSPARALLVRIPA